MTSKYNLRIQFYTYCIESELENIIDQLKDGVILKIRRYMYAPIREQFYMKLNIDCPGYTEQIPEKYSSTSVTIYHLKLTNIQRIQLMKNIHLVKDDCISNYFITENEYTKSLPFVSYA